MATMMTGSLVALLLCMCVASHALLLPESRSASHSEAQKNLKNDEYFSSKAKRNWFSIALNAKSQECFFSGYTPNGPIVDIAKIKSPEATLGSKSGLAAILSGAKKMGQGAAVIMHGMKFSAMLMKKAPMLGPALGVFSALTGFINPAPTADDILKSVNTAVGKLTTEVNRKLDQMKGYVDSKITKLEKDLIRGEYETNFRLWSACINEPSEELVNECQRDAVKLLTAERGKFTPLASELKNRKPGTKVSFDKVRKLEAYMLAFRDYANLVIMQLTPLLQYYCIAKKNVQYASHYCDVYSSSLNREAEYFIDYATLAIRVIKDGHWGTNYRGACPNTIKCDGQKEVREGFWNAHTANTQKCRCEIESSNTKKYCEVKFTVRADGKRPYTNYFYKGRSSLDAGGREFGGRVLQDLARTYQIKNHKIMDKYWQDEILAFVPEWRNAVALAKDMKSKNPKSSGDAPSMEFSGGFASRLETSGYKFREVEDAEEVMDGMNESSDESDEDDEDQLDENGGTYDDEDYEDSEDDDEEEI